MARCHLDAMVGGQRLRCRLSYGRIKEIEAFFAQEYPDLENAFQQLAMAISLGEVEIRGLVKVLEFCMLDKPEDPEFTLEAWFEEDEDPGAAFELATKLITEGLAAGKKRDAAAGNVDQADTTLKEPSSSA